MTILCFYFILFFFAVPYMVFVFCDILFARDSFSDKRCLYNQNNHKNIEHVKEKILLNTEMSEKVLRDVDNYLYTEQL